MAIHSNILAWEIPWTEEPRGPQSIVKRSWTQLSNQTTAIRVCVCVCVCARACIEEKIKRIRDTKGTFCAKMGTIKDRNGMDLTEAGHIKKGWQEHTEELYKKDLHDPGNHNGVITHLEPDILECEVKWALGSITMNKARGGNGIPVELFQILKDDVVKVLHSVCQQIWKTQQWPQDWKRCFHSNPKERQCQRMFILSHDCTHFTH